MARLKHNKEALAVEPPSAQDPRVTWSGLRAGVPTRPLLPTRSAGHRPRTKPPPRMLLDGKNTNMAATKIALGTKNKTSNPRCTGLFSHRQTLTFSSMLFAPSRQPFPTASSSVWRCFFPSRLPAWRDRGHNESVARVTSPAKACVRFGHPRRVQQMLTRD